MIIGTCLIVWMCYKLYKARWAILECFLSHVLEIGAMSKHLAVEGWIVCTILVSMTLLCWVNVNQLTVIGWF